jgi:hypothetical protein
VAFDKGAEDEVKWRGPLPGRVLTADTGEGIRADEVREGGGCCPGLVALLEDDDVPLRYEGRVREWSFFVFAIGDPEQPDWREHLTRQRLFYCPCCGSEFPDSLRVPYFERLRAIGIDDPWLQRDEVSAEYKSSQWWREAGL